MKEPQDPKHTPGPWSVRADTGRIAMMSDLRVQAREHADGLNLLKPIARLYLQGSEVKANARLIAAAPDLLEACRAAYAWFTDDVLTDDARKAVILLREAIAKATAAGEVRDDA
jgi:hypothetical protein